MAPEQPPGPQVRHPHWGDLLEVLAVAALATSVRWVLVAPEPAARHALWFALFALVYTPFLLGRRGLEGLDPRRLRLRAAIWSRRRELDRRLARGGESFL